MMELERRQKENRLPRFEFRGAALILQTAQDMEIGLEGPAGTGKSAGALYKLDRCARKWPRARFLIVRQTRESLNESGLVTFERDILGDESPIALGPRRENRHAYLYPNGSEIIVGGLKQSGKDVRAKVMSTEYDIIYVQEGIELLEDDYQKLTTRLRNGIMPYQQIIMDFNPDVPTHWVYLREQRKQIRLLYSSHHDNPRLWDGKDWTAEGAAYMARLGQLTGVMRARYLLGQRVMAAGLVYGDVWADGPIDGNVTEAAEYVAGQGPVLWGVDDGYAGELDPATGLYTATSHPRVFLLCQLRPNGILCVFEEHAAVKKLSDEHIKEVLALPYPAPDFAAVDKSAAELIGRLNRASIHTRRSPASVEESIKNAREWFGPDTNGVRKILVHPRCRHLRAEMGSYHYETGTEKPVKQFDHGADATRYLLWTLRHTN